MKLWHSNSHKAYGAVWWLRQSPEHPEQQHSTAVQTLPFGCLSDRQLLNQPVGILSGHTWYGINVPDMPEHAEPRVILKVPSSMSEPLSLQDISVWPWCFWPGEALRHNIGSLLETLGDEPWTYTCWQNSRWPKTLRFSCEQNSTQVSRPVVYLKEKKLAGKGNILRRCHEIYPGFQILGKYFKNFWSSITSLKGQYFQMTFS